MELLSLIVVAPLELLFRGLFEIIQVFVKNLGLALLTLSFVTVGLMVPLEKCVRPLVQREKLIEGILEPQIRCIKERFVGAEQHAALKRLYARYRYNPILSVYSALGVLIQLPFLLGAYWMLTNYSAIKGVPFGPIADLSAPDGLIAGINLLPLLMTAINLMTIVVSRLEKRDAIQALVVALLFLVLLYTAPSALLVYWTMNNVLHLFRAFLKNHIQSLTNFAVCHLLVQAEKLFQTNTKLLAGAFLFGAFLRSSRTAYVFAQTQNYGWLYAIILLALFVFVCWRISARVKSFFGELRNPMATFAAALLFIALGWFVTTRVLVLVELQTQELRKFQLATLFSIGILIAVMFGAVIDKVFQKVKLSLTQSSRGVNQTAAISGAALLFLVLVWVPLSTYSSDPRVFTTIIPTSFAYSRFTYFLTALLVYFLLWLILKPLRNLFSFAVIFTALTSVTFSFLVAPDYGALDNFFLQHEQELSRPVNRLIDVVVYVGAFFLLVFLVLRRKVQLLASVFLLGLIALIFGSFQKIDLAEEILARNASPMTVELTGDSIPKYVKDFHTFSKTGKNVVVIFLDMFTGGNMKEILQVRPEIKEQLDGFTWYKDVVTAGTSTIFGKPGILGGEQATPWELDKDQSVSLEEKINKAWAKFFNVLVDDNFRIRVSEDVWLRSDLISTYIKSPERQIFGTSPFWDKSVNVWQRRLNRTFDSKTVNYNRFWFAMGLFNVSPLTRRVKIYQFGSWLNAIDTGGASVQHARRWLAELDTHADFSSVSNDSLGRFIFVSTLLTHVPWALDEQCLPCKNGGWNESRDLSKGGISPEHLRTESCAILSVIRWLDWMKTNHVYDNTQVIVISDHGRGDSSELVALNKGQFYPINPHGLLLVKDFGQRGELRVDQESRMANWDLPILVLRNVFGDDKYPAPWKDANRVRYHVAGDWQRPHHERTHFSNLSMWKIEGSIYEMNRWKRIR